MDAVVESALISAAATVLGVGATATVAVVGLRLSRSASDKAVAAARETNLAAIDAARSDVQAMERIARESPPDHPTVMEVLAAFVREHSQEQWQQAEPGTQASERTTRPDVQAALTVIGRRDPERDRQAIDLAGTNLTGANLGVTDFRLVKNLPGLREIRRPSFAGSVLAGANLTGANLSLADFRFANLIGANLTRANLDGANLIGAQLNTAQLAHADLRNARFIGSQPLARSPPLAGRSSSLRPERQNARS